MNATQHLRERISAGLTDAVLPLERSAYKRKAKTQKVCEQCGKPYLGRPDSLFCGRKCRQLAYFKAGDKPVYAGMATGTIGALGELRVAVDLLEKGYEVYRSVSPSCSADIIIWKAGRCVRVEVKTGVRGKAGQLICDRKSFRADVLAVVLKSGIVYEPPLPHAVRVMPKTALQGVLSTTNPVVAVTTNPGQKARP